MAYSAPVHSLYAYPYEVPDAAATADALAGEFPWLDRDLLAKRLSSKTDDFVYIARHLTPAQYFEALRLGLPGVRSQKEYRRIYPQGSLVAHVVGLTRSDQTAISGIEAYYDADLVGAAQDPVALSIDVRVQAVVREELQAQIDTYAAAGGAGVVMDVRTGELVASVSLPDFDPNQLGKRDPKLEHNRVSNGVYELGSVFKPIVAAIALDTNVAKSDTMLDATRPIYVDGYTIRDFHGRNRWLSVSDVLVHSSNIGAARLAVEVGVERLVQYFDRFGLLTAPNMDVYEVRAPQAPAKWQELNAMTSAYGYGLSVSPAQFVAAFAALVNGGTLYSPTLLQINDFRSAQGKTVLRAETSAAMRGMLRQVVANGTGRNADTRLYPVGGKTGGKVAAPAISRIVDRIAPMLGVKPQPAQMQDKQQKRSTHGLVAAVARN